MKVINMINNSNNDGHIVSQSCLDFCMILNEAEQ